ncbi:hypothetical protein [Streptomyces sp. NPDC057325]|uniref:hypothetical protein n=1 Tax=unclassified Streptomyces TaxID=2593676 RepID=UPI003628B1E6
MEAGRGYGGAEHLVLVGRQGRRHTEYHGLHTDAAGNVGGTGRVTFREYYDLDADPHQLSDSLHRATPAQEKALGVPGLAAAPADDRAS